MKVKFSEESGKDLFKISRKKINLTSTTSKKTNSKGAEAREKKKGSY